MKATTANAADKRRATNTPAPSFVLITAKYNSEKIFSPIIGIGIRSIKGSMMGLMMGSAGSGWMEIMGHAGATHCPGARGCAHFL